MLKKAKADNSNPDKPAKPKKEKAPKEPKDPKAKGGQSQYFWVVWLENRRKKKANLRPSSIPKQPMTKEDKFKLIGAGAIVVGIIVILIVMQVINANKVAEEENAPKKPNVTK